MAFEPSVRDLCNFKYAINNELIEGRSQIHSTVFCSQYQEAGWLERLGGGTSAEGIVDRISNNAYRIRLTGDVNMRETTSKVKR